jgi:hypothetical protein
VWGPALVAWGLWVASVNTRVQPAVLGAILAVVMSGLVANLMLVQFVQYGPSWIAYTLQVGARQGGCWMLVERPPCGGMRPAAYCRLPVQVVPCTYASSTSPAWYHLQCVVVAWECTCTAKACCV